MHHLVKKAAINKYGPMLAEGKPADEIKAAIASDEKNFTPDEVEEIFNALGKPADDGDGDTGPTPITGSENTGVSQVLETKVEEPVNNPNAGLELSRFDYGNMLGTSFLDYTEMVSRLPVDKKFDFEVYKVEPIKSERYPGLKNTPVDVIGFRIKDNTPVKTTRIFPAHAIDNNGRLQVNGTLRVLIGAQWDKNGGNPNSYGLFFLLKK